MPPALVRSRRLAAAVALTSVATLAGCSLGGDSTLPPYSDPATQTYNVNTGVTIGTMTRVNEHIYQEDVVVGTGRVVAVGDSISVYYAGRLSGGFQFDARARPNAPFVAKLDSFNLIKGWVLGLAGMRVGGTRRLAIGPESAYRYSTVRDQAGNVIIPPNSVLAFDVEVTAATSAPPQ